MAVWAISPEENRLGLQGNLQPLPAIRLQMTDDLPAADQTVKESQQEKERKRKDRPNGLHAGHLLLLTCRWCVTVLKT